MDFPHFYDDFLTPTDKTWSQWLKQGQTVDILVEWY